MALTVCYHSSAYPCQFVGQFIFLYAHKMRATIKECCNYPIQFDQFFVLFSFTLLLFEFLKRIWCYRVYTVRRYFIFTYKIIRRLTTKYLSLFCIHNAMGPLQVVWNAFFPQTMQFFLFLVVWNFTAIDTLLLSNTWWFLVILFCFLIYKLYKSYVPGNCLVQGTCNTSLHL